MLFFIKLVNWILCGIVDLGHVLGGNTISSRLKFMVDERYPHRKPHTSFSGVFEDRLISLELIIETALVFKWWWSSVRLRNLLVLDLQKSEKIACQFHCDYLNINFNFFQNLLQHNKIIFLFQFFNKNNFV